jgi:hypothetical protein
MFFRQMYLMLTAIILTNYLDKGWTQVIFLASKFNISVNINDLYQLMSHMLMEILSFRILAPCSQLGDTLN